MTFQPGETTKTIAVSVNGDTKVESDETFFVVLSNPSGATLAQDTGTGAILNDDSATISIVPAALALPEGDSGLKPFEFTVSLSVPTALPVTVRVDTVDGTATTADNDYLPLENLVLTFTSGGPLEQTVKVDVVGDTKGESNETFQVVLSEARWDGELDDRISIDIAQATGTILNDDPLVGVQMVAVAVPSAAGAMALPSSLDMVALGGTYYVEIWVQDRVLPGAGISGGKVDANYKTAVADAVNVFNLDFDMFPDGVIDDPNGLVKNLGGGTMAGGRGIAPQWARLGYVEFVATDLGEATFALSPGSLAFSRFTVGNVPRDLVDLGTPIVVDQIGGTRIDMTIVREPSAIGDNGEVTNLPASAGWVHEWQSFWIEIWVSTPETPSLAVAGASVDLQYYTGFTTAQEIVYGPAFTLNLTGAIDDSLGLVSGIGGRTALTNVGDDAYVLLARVRFASIDGDQVAVDQAGRNIGPYDMQMALAGGQSQLVGGSSVLPVLGATPSTELWAVVYDIDDNNQIDFGDFSFFAAALGRMVGAPASEPPYVWWADFDKTGRVDFGDLAFFAPNFGKSRSGVQAGTQTLIFPTNFPNAWRAVPAASGGEGEAMGAGDLLQASSAGAGMLVGFGGLQGSQVPSLQRAFAVVEESHAAERSATGLTARLSAAADAMFARLGTAEAERTPPWLRPRVATVGHGSRLLEASQQPESPVTLHSRSEPSVTAPTERLQRWTEHWEPLEDLLSLLADQPSDRLRDPHEALFAQAGG